MQRLAFAWHNYGNPIIGARSDIEAVPIDRLQAFYRTWYQPDNALLIVGGRFDDAARARAGGEALRRRSRAPRARCPRSTPPSPMQDGERSVTLRRVGDTPLVAAMYRVPAGAHPDYPAVDVLVEALRVAPQGRLHQALVQKGLASPAWGGERALRDPGVMYFGAALPKDGALEAARAALLAMLDGVRSEPLRADEMERARTSLLNEMEKAQLDGRHLVSMLSEFEAVGDWRLFFLYRDRLRAVSARRRAARGRDLPAPGEPRARHLRADAQARSARKSPRHPTCRRRSPATRAARRWPRARPSIPRRRTSRRACSGATLANGMRTALLPKRTRGGKVVVQLNLNWGDEASKAGRNTACTLAGGMLLRGTREALARRIARRVRPPQGDGLGERRWRHRSRRSASTSTKPCAWWPRCCAARRSRPPSSRN